MIKQSSMQARTAATDLYQKDGHSTSKTLGAASGLITAATQKYTPNIGTDVRTSIKNGSKRRANSNHTTDKKVNLDKFLSVVQQRSNFTPTS